MTTPDFAELGIELQDRFGKRHWVPLLELLRLVVAIVQTESGEKENT